MTAPSSSQRPALALRLGVTGARQLDPMRIPRLSAQLRSVLADPREHLRRLAATNGGVAAAYEHTNGRSPEPRLRFLSPLARGADRLAAREALDAGYTLHVPMPFPLAEYERDFDTPEDLAEFRELLGKADEGYLALDGARGPEMNRAYETVGRFVVRHCDLLIAIWDGGPSGGRGGSAQILRYAAGSGVPVCWLHATEDRSPVWIAGIQDLVVPRPDPEPIEAPLHAWLDTLIVPPVDKPGTGPSPWLAWLSAANRRAAPLPREELANVPQAASVSPERREPGPNRR